MPTFKIILAYDGTDFVGWQRQASGASIQGLLEDALRDLEQREVGVIGAGRTDAGVHALGQVASFSLNRTMEDDALVGALNARLPGAIRVMSASRVSDSFHARFAAIKKTYRYRIWNAEVLSPFERRYVWHVTEPLNREAMSAAAQVLEGRHDFAAFRAAGTLTRSTERQLFSSRLLPGPTSSAAPPNGSEADAPEIVYEVCGDGFLRHMVRAIVGTLVEVGRGRRSIDWVQGVLAGRDRSTAGPTAPPQGLVLVRVDYDGVRLAAER